MVSGKIVFFLSSLMLLTSCSAPTYTIKDFEKTSTTIEVFTYEDNIKLKEMPKVYTVLDAKDIRDDLVPGTYKLINIPKDFKGNIYRDRYGFIYLEVR